MNWADINGSVVRYEVTGAGSPIVLVHEMGGTLNSWDAVTTDLARSHQVLRYDLRGAGLSEKASGQLVLDDLADHLDALIRHVGITAPVVIVAAAVGTSIALRHAMKRPDRVAGIVGFSPVIACPEDKRVGVLAHAERIETEGLRALAPTSIPNILPEVLRADDAAFQAARARWLANDPRSFAAIYRMFAHLDLTAEIAAIRTPCLMIGATHDGLRPAVDVRALAGQLPRATFRELSTGHIAAVQTPALVAETVRGFAASLA